jgi:hypothetical protein
MNIIVTIIGSAVVFTVVFGFAAYSRYLQHKETMALAEKGLLPSEITIPKGKGIFQWGLVFSGLGLILILILIPFAWNKIWFLFLLGLFPLALGLGLILIYVIMQDNPVPESAATVKQE